jgi:hypothetical protein
MASVTKVIDVVSEPVNSSGNTAMQSIPVKIDASQMQQVLQNLARQQPQIGSSSVGQSAGVAVEPQTERINPSVYMRNISEEMEKLYARFDKLKKLAVELHGRQLDTSIPEHVRIKNIVIDFTVTKDGKEEAHTAEIQSVASIGDITGLMSTEFGVIILALSEQAKQLEDLAQKTGERCSSALAEWETNNKDKKIVRTGEAAAVSVDVADTSAEDGPITLEAV